jgi:hypothetical protein
MRLFPVSATRTFPFASTATPRGPQNELADSAIARHRLAVLSPHLDRGAVPRELLDAMVPCIAHIDRPIRADRDAPGFIESSDGRLAREHICKRAPLMQETAVRGDVQDAMIARVGDIEIHVFAACDGTWRVQAARIAFTPEDLVCGYQNRTRLVRILCDDRLRGGRRHSSISSRPHPCGRKVSSGLQGCQEVNVMDELPTACEYFV